MYRHATRCKLSVIAVSTRCYVFPSPRFNSPLFQIMLDMFDVVLSMLIRLDYVFVRACSSDLD